MTEHLKTPTLYVLRHKPTGTLMPGFKGRAGGTYVDPWKPETHNGLPRLFASAKAARDALHWWAKGRVRMEITTDQNWLGQEYHEKGMAGSDPVEDRKAGDWEAVPVKIADYSEEEQFIRWMEQHFVARVPTIKHPRDHAEATFEEYMKGCGVEFGNKNWAWDEAAAHEAVEMELEHWEAEPE